MFASIKPVEIAKYAAYLTVESVATKATATTITKTTSAEDDDTVTYVGSHVAGMIVANRLKQHTDNAVESAANFITTKRENRRNKKTAKQQ